MNKDIIEALNLEIARLTEARNLIDGTHLTSRTTGARHRRPMSDATKKKIAAAMAKRWAAKRAATRK